MIFLGKIELHNIDILPLCAADEPELIKLYENFGSKWLWECVQRTLVYRGKCFSIERKKKLYDFINHRLDMLFVNNRGETLENIDEKRFQLLKTNLSVYESEQIQCQITFQNKTITLNSSECSSWALEYDKKKVILYIRKDLPTLDYIDISTELTRFFYKKPLDTLVHSISDKLSSALETLKRRGTPVDRLLKVKEQQPINFKLHIQQQQLPSLIPPPQPQQAQQQLPPIAPPPLFVPLQIPSQSQSTRNPSIENIQSRIERDRINNFDQYKFNDDNDISRSMISSNRPYSQKEFNQTETNRHEINNSCEFIPSSNMIRYENLLHGIPLYIDKNVIITNLMIDQGKQLAYLLSRLAQQVFNLPVQTIHLFRDIDSARIAFNSNGSLFYNLRYFEQVFADELKIHIENGSSLSSSSNPIVRRIVNFYFMVTCHKLSHNIDSNHDLNFINRLERAS
ncbi:unnamed protein product, partial [Rotaria sordida]